MRIPNAVANLSRSAIYAIYAVRRLFTRLVSSGQNLTNLTNRSRVLVRTAQFIYRARLFIVCILLLGGLSDYALLNLGSLLTQSQTKVPSCTVPTRAATSATSARSVASSASAAIRPSTVSFVDHSATTTLVTSNTLLAPQTSAIGSGSTMTVLTTSFTVDVRSAPVCVYNVPVDRSVSLMYPAVDAHGMVWFGKMGANLLARLDPRTGALREWRVPGGRRGIMDTIVDGHGAVWFTESAANFVGRFEPSTERFTTYPLPLVDGMNAEPVRLWSDGTGMVWFTAHQGMRLGRLNPTTGAMRLWRVPRLAVLDTFAHPYSIAITPEGEVWFGTAERGGALGRLNPVTGKVQFYPRPPCHNWPQDVVALAPDRAGRVWFIEHQYACMGYIETATGKVTEWQLPTGPLGEARVLNGMILDARTGALWTTSTSANALIKYVPESGSYTYYPLPKPNSIPFGVTLDARGVLYFTADGGPNATYIGALTP